MKLTLEQAKLVSLTMELDMKAMEYKKLCDELDDLKNKKIDPNDPILLELKDKFSQNLDEILKIKNELKKLQDK